MISEGDLAYLKKPGQPVREVQINSLGTTIKVEVVKNGRLIEANPSEVWKPEVGTPSLA